MEQGWTVRGIAAASGRSIGLVSRWARQGLIPGYQARRFRNGAGIPAELGEAYVLLLKVGACSQQLAETARTDPAAVIAASEALAVIGRAALAAPQLADDGEAA